MSITIEYKIKVCWFCDAFVVNILIIVALIVNSNEMSVEEDDRNPSNSNSTIIRVTHALNYSDAPFHFPTRQNSAKKNQN